MMDMDNEELLEALLIAGRQRTVETDRNCFWEEFLERVMKRMKEEKSRKVMRELGIVASDIKKDCTDCEYEGCEPPSSLL